MKTFIFKKESNLSPSQVCDKKIELKCLVRQFDSQYNISSNIGSFFSSSMGYLKSFGSTIDSQLNSNEHTQGIYNELKDAVKGISVCLCI